MNIGSGWVTRMTWLGLLLTPLPSSERAPKTAGPCEPLRQGFARLALSARGEGRASASCEVVSRFLQPTIK